MVTIHGQSDQIRLTGEAAQRRALDQFGGAAHAALLEEYREAFREAVDTKHRSIRCVGMRTSARRSSRTCAAPSPRSTR